MTVKDVTYSVENDADGVFISENEVLGLAEKASLKVSESGTYTVNGTTLEVTENDVVDGLNDSYAYIATGEQFNANATTAEILEGLGVEESEAVVVPTDASGDQRATLDNNGGLAVIEETETPVTIVGGTGDDTVVSKGENVLFNMAHGGDDKVIALDGNIKLENYDPRSNSGIQLTPEDMKAGVKFGDGIIELANANVELSNNFVNLYDVAGNKELIGFATNEDKLVDASELTEGISIIGGGESSGNEVKKATLKGGSGDDSIIGGKEASINAGEGNNYIEVADNGGAAIVYGGGNDTIQNFNFADEEGADTIHNAAFTDVAVENGNVILTTEKGTITVNDAENKDIALDKDVTLQVGENIKYDGVANKYIATGENASVTVGENYSTEEKPVIALDEMEGNANNVDASEFEGTAEITGNSGDNVIAASKGGSTIDGGAGNDSMKGGDGADEFISTSGDDTISNFEFGTGETADKLNAGENAITKVKVDGEDIILVTENGTTKVENAAGQTMQFQNQHTNNSTIAAQFAKDTLSVNDDANFYWAAENNAVVAVGNEADSSTTVVVDLSNANYNNAEQLSFFGDIKEIDASEFEGAASLKGNDKNNIIKASKGGSTLNGGVRNDKLIGGAGVDTFVYEQGNGKDTISNFEFGTGETADILDVDTNAIKKVKVYDDDVILEFAEGGALKIEDAAGKTIQLQSTNTENETIAAQFGSGTISVNDDSDFYWAAGENATVEIANYSADTVKVDLSNANYNDAEQLSFYGDIRTVDATGYKGYANISGNDSNNVIIGGDYYNYLWGGDGAVNDTLIGGGEYNTFIYKKGNGNDIIKDETTTTTSSYVEFYGLTLDDIKSVTSTDSSIDIKFNDGGSVSIETSKKIGFTFERSAFTYTYNRETKQFESHEQGCY